MKIADKKQTETDIWVDKILFDKDPSIQFITRCTSVTFSALFACVHPKCAALGALLQLLDRDNGLADTKWGMVHTLALLMLGTTGMLGCSQATCLYSGTLLMSRLRKTVNDLVQKKIVAHVRGAQIV